MAASPAPSPPVAAPGGEGKDPGKEKRGKEKREVRGDKSEAGVGGKEASSSRLRPSHHDDGQNRKV